MLSPRLMPRLDTDMDTAEAMEDTPEAMAMVDTDTDTARDLPMLSPKPMLTTTVLAILMPTPDMPLPTTDTALSDMLTISSERDLLMPVTVTVTPEVMVMAVMVMAVDT